MLPEGQYAYAGKRFQAVLTGFQLPISPAGGPRGWNRSHA